MSFPAVAFYHKHGKSASGQSYNHLDADFFDQYLTFDPVDNEGRNCSSGLHERPSSLSDDELLDQDNWQKESWAQIPASVQQTTTEGFLFYSESSGRAAISDTELLSLEGMSLHSSRPEADFRSLPSSPLHDPAALPSRSARIVNSLSKKIKSSAADIEKSLRSPIRKPTTSQKTTCKSSTTWGQKVDSANFDFDMETLSSHHVPKTPHKAGNNSAKLDQENCDLVFSPSNATPRKLRTGAGASQTPLSTSMLEPDSSRRASSQSRGHEAFPLTPQQDHHSNGWSQIPNSAEMSHYSSDGSIIWWNHASAALMAQPSPTALHVNPQRATKSLALQLQDGLLHSEKEALIPPLPNGLTISMDSSTSQSSFMVQSLPHQRRYFGPPQSHYHARPSHNGHHRSKRYPPNGSMRHKLPPSSESESPSPKSFHARTRKTQKSSKHSTPRTPSLGGAVDFVNFTPNDSKQILTGVAPSGSSKTKARREREAMEKRRKLSQAAVRAVRAAGGDVESLVEQGLLC